MAASKKLHEIYADQMSRRHDFGHPMYEPVSSELIKVGMVGYLDQRGQWNPICDLNDDAALKERGLLPLTERMERAPDDEDIAWGPKCSESVKGSRFDSRAGADASSAGIPAGAEVVYKYKSSTEFGAILMTEPPILRQAVYHDQLFRDWVKTNSAKLLKTRPEVKEHGLWVVRWTYATKRSSLNAWTSKDKDVTIGFNAKVIGAGEVGPSGGWYESENDSGWMHAQAKGTEKKVVFFGGLRFHYGKTSFRQKDLKEGLPSSKWTFRGEGSREGMIQVPINDEELCEVTCTEVGRLDLDAAEAKDDADF